MERLKEDAPGPALDADAARRTAEREAAARWGVDFTLFAPVEQGQERRLGGRVDHTFTYERRSPTLNEGRYRLRLVVSGDRLTEVTHFIKIPEAFSRRYARMRSANEAIGIGSVVALALLYGVGGIGIGLFVMLRRGWVLWRHAVFWGAFVGLLQVLASLNEFPLLWMTYDTALPRATFMAQQIAVLTATAIGMSLFFALSFMAAETLTRRAFGGHPQLWRVWSKGPGSSTAILGRTMGGYLLVAVFFAYDVLLYVITTRTFGWWSPSEALLHPDVLATYAPWLSAIANSFQAGFWEESLFRAVPLAGAALIGDRFGKRNLFLVLGFIVQAIVFGAGHAPYPNQPSFARPVELLIPSIGFGLLYVYLGPPARYRPALHLRRGLVRAADFPDHRSRRLVPARDGRDDDARAAVDCPLAAPAIGRVDGPRACRSQRGLDAACRRPRVPRRCLRLCIRRSIPV